MAALICLVLGGFSLQWDITDVRDDERLLAEGLQAQGVVMRTYEERRGTARYGYNETVASIIYSPSNGNEVLITHTVRKAPTEGLEDQEVTLFYNPADPSEAVVEEWRDGYDWMTAGAVLFLAGGAFTVGAGTRSYIRGRRKPAGQPL
ncbi:MULTISPECIES: DUF3592 domain-containing protein [unclassified Arthrobacter]|uniref:DUF3592 domain-containing protein n=1 Tax=unclassified Arthrobacter TaxID=235627 RepID=UPI001D1412B7|nr:MULTISPECIES: DUF3592 domain-containing protein [unclassified Arthrobacter]MCC3289390.1 DUF3592 domain-containing protein [Arthrobacter sp. zg-Y1110]MCC3301093.1 DUF3592 domain-containing protein [Arthrobacter sp. zg-Y895]UWX85162.1 DUF3592 domain-containing protein [Arthrobacter sp. zg-Y1110]